jgi:hypothetical protein
MLDVKGADLTPAPHTPGRYAPWRPCGHARASVAQRFVPVKVTGTHDMSENAYFTIGIPTLPQSRAYGVLDHRLPLPRLAHLSPSLRSLP